MKSHLRLKQHSILSGQMVIEIWYAGQFIGQVAGADGPGVRVISKYELSTTTPETPPVDINCTEVRIKCP